MKIPKAKEVQVNPGDEDKYLTLKELSGLTEECYQTWRIRVVDRNELPYLDISKKSSPKRRPRVRVSDYKKWWQRKIDQMGGFDENNPGD